jgi:hypothetical protein
MMLRAVVLTGVALLLAGCFDARYDLGLNNDGSGTIAVDIVLDKDLSRDIIKDGKGKLDKQANQSQLGKNAKNSQRVENGSIVVNQRLAFKTLSEITGGDVDVEVQNLGRNFVGVSRSRIRLATSRNPAKAKADSGGAMADQFVGQMFKGHEMRVTMHLPCAVESADELRHDGAVYAPKVEKSWFSGSTVEWRVPMADILALQAHGGRHDFVATCWSWAGITPGRNRPGK